MTIIDSQVHAYEANAPKRPWQPRCWPVRPSERTCNQFGAR